MTNQPAQIIELSLQGKVLRTIPLTGFGDAEAIEYISRGVYVITDERQQRLVKVRLEGRHALHRRCRCPAAFAGYPSTATRVSKG